MGFNKKTVLIALVISLLVLGAGCWGGGDGETPPDDPPNGSAGTAEVTVYFFNGEGELVPVVREVALDEDTPENRLRAAVDELLKGPAAEEADRLYSQIPENVELLGVEISRPYATLDFSAELEQMGGTTRVFGTLDQLTWTATTLDEVSGLILEVEGERVGTDEHLFTGEGVLFDRLYRPAAGDWAREASPAKCLETFLVTIGPNVEEMWSWMGPRARELYGTPENIDWTALAEDLGSWRDYEVVEEIIRDDVATVTIKGDRVVEGTPEPDAAYPARMVREDGIWKWDLRAD
jgi:hypothetical protein